ncbi:MAG: 50S ribosomal protein L32 [Bdellovibrionota bacterium]|jgi:large subunit ribosomal protein L32
MGVPKKRTTKSRRNQRRSHDSLTAAHPIICPNCGERVLPHHVCMACGQYRGKTIIDMSEEDTTQEK